MANLFSRIIISTLLYVHTLLLLEAEHCGYPGSPAYGKPKNVKNTYEPGETVTFSCNSGYFLIGANTRRCLSDGTWSGQLPVCDIALSPTGVTSASSSLDSYPPENVVDGNKQSCMFTRDAKPRWWRLDMGKAYHVLYVAITIPYSNSYQQFTTYVISVKNQNILYHRCSSFNGKFASQTVVLHCGDGQGIFGHYIHIEDNRPDFTYFALCQVDVIVLKERYACGEPDHPTQAYTTREHNTVEYHCVSGYRLKGNPRRRCLRSGQWDGLQRTCIEVTCRRLDEVQNGRVRMNGLRRNRPVQGSNAFYSCEGGYVLHGNATRECKEDGSWSGGDSSCYPINCGFPRHQTVGGKYYLLNETTTYQSMAKLECLDEHKAFGPSSLITCREDGTWSGSQASCVSEGNTDAAMRQSEDGDEFSLNIIVGMVLLGIIIVLLMVGFLVIRRRRSASEKQSVSLPSRDFDSLGSSCVASTRSLANGSLYQNEDYYSELPLESISQKSSVDDFTKKNISQIGIYSNLDPSGSLCRINVSENSYNSTNPSVKRKSKSSSRKSSTSKENVYEEIPFSRNALNNLKNTQNEFDSRNLNDTVLPLDGNKSKDEVIFLPSTLESNSKPSTSVIDPAILALYAKVDFEKKRKSRISKSQNNPRGFESDKENAMNSDLGNGNCDASSNQPQSSRFNGSNTEKSGEFDIVPFRPRKLPPTPVKEDIEHLENDGNHTTSTNKQVSATPCVFLDNVIYAGDNNNTTVMIENDLYSSA